MPTRTSPRLFNSTQNENPFTKLSEVLVSCNRIIVGHFKNQQKYREAPEIEDDLAEQRREWKKHSEVVRRYAIRKGIPFEEFDRVLKAGDAFLQSCRQVAAGNSKRSANAPAVIAALTACESLCVVERLGQLSFTWEGHDDNATISPEFHQIAPISLLDLPAIRQAISDLYRIVENPIPSNPVVRRIKKEIDKQIPRVGPNGPIAPETDWEKLPQEPHPAWILQGKDWVLHHIGRDSRVIADSQVDMGIKAALLSLQEALRDTVGIYHIGTDAGLRIQFLDLLGNVLRSLGASSFLANDEQVPAESSTADPSKDAGGKSPAHRITTVFYHGGLSYSVAGQFPIVVSPECHAVLAQFLKDRRALATRELKCENASRILRSVSKKFPGSVRFPKAKGEGYFIDVKEADSTT